MKHIQYQRWYKLEMDGVEETYVVSFTRSESFYNVHIHLINNGKSNSQYYSRTHNGFITAIEQFDKYCQEVEENNFKFDYERTELY